MRPCFRRLPVLALLAALLLLGGCSGGKTTEVTITERPAPTAAPTASPAPPKSKTPAPKPKTTEPKSIAPEPTPAVVLLPLDAPETEIPDADARAVSTPEPEPQTETYVLNTNTKKFHRPGCRSVGEMAEKNKRVVESTREDVIASGYEPCKICKP